MRLLLAAPLLLACSLAAAADTRPATAVEVARVALPRASWDQVVAASGAQMDQMAGQIVQSSVPEADRAAALEVLRAGMKDYLASTMPSYEEMLDFQAGLLAKHWSEAELRELAAFYRSPVGQKTVRVMPEVMRDAMGWMQARVQQQLPAVVERMKATAEEAAARRGKK